MSDSTLELTILMPCLDEAQTLGSCLRKARGFLIANAIKGEIIVADNGSTDGSIRIAEEHGARIVHVAERGYGAALSGGLAEARGKYVIMGDADDSYDFAALGTILKKLRQGYDLVMGNRFKGGIKKGAMPFLNRYLGNPVLSGVGRLFFNAKIGDFHCGLRGFKRNAILGLHLQTTGMEYASEMVVCASLNHLKITEVPVTLWPDGRLREPHLKRWHDGWRHLRFMLLYSPRWLYLYPGIALVLFGLILSLLLLPGPLMIAEGVGLDVHSLLIGAMSLMLGIQALTFGLIARSYASLSGILPPINPNASWIHKITLERMLTFGACLLAAGIGGIVLATQKWSDVHFGPLDYRAMMRLLIVSVTFVLAGFQLGFTGFMMGVMQIQRKPRS